MTSSRSSGEPRGSGVLELAAVCLLAIATLGSAWCAYQASQWNGEETRLARLSSDEKVEAVRLFGLATQTVAYDTNTFGLYAAAIADDNEGLAAFYREALVRSGALPIIEQWTADVEAGRAPTKLLDDEEYIAGLLEPYDETSATAEETAQRSLDAGDTAESYVLATVLLAMSLFFAGVMSSFRVRFVRLVLLAASGSALAFAAANIAELSVI